jgi:hypothetical protein
MRITSVTNQHLAPGRVLTVHAIQAAKRGDHHAMPVMRRLKRSKKRWNVLQRAGATANFNKTSIDPSP